MAPAAPAARAAGARLARFVGEMRAVQARLADHRELSAEASKRAHAAADHAALALHNYQIGNGAGASASHSEAVKAFEAAALIASSEGAAELLEGGNFIAQASAAIVAVQAFDSFLATGSLGCRSPAAINDESWLTGLISASHEISRYASNRAAHGDVVSVNASWDVVTTLQEALVQFDLRNGALRRSFDSLKYVVKRLEATRYELSLFPPDASSATTSDHKWDTKSLLDMGAVDLARVQMATFDSMREVVIKKCREPQKLAKQAIFALHRGDSAGAERLLTNASSLASSILTEECTTLPALRHQGSMTSMLEEFAEAAMFYHFMCDQQTLLTHNSPALLGGVLTTGEYLGGLCDLTGEIGRHAVRLATARDADGVRMCLDTVMEIQSAMLMMAGVLPRGLSKKAEGLKQAITKMETLLYELSLVSRSGRTHSQPASSTVEAMLDHVDDEEA